MPRPEPDSPLSCALCVMAKAPLPGLAKTRLAPVLGSTGAAEFAKHLVLHTQEICLQLAGEIDTQWCLSPEPSDPSWRASGLVFTVSRGQGDGDLGQRMGRIARDILEGYDAVLLIGCDCPSLSPDHLRQAVAALQQYDSVMIPALDGGYVLLGLRKYTAEVFRDINWGSEHVAAQTRTALHKAGLEWVELPPLRDIDDAGDLPHLPESLVQQLPPAQQQTIQRLDSKGSTDAGLRG